MNIVSLIKKYKSSVTRKYIFVSKDEIDTIPKNELFISKKIDGQLWFYCKSDKDSKIINASESEISDIIQDIKKDLDKNKSIYDVISGGQEDIIVGGKSINARAYCSRFNFAGADQQKKVGVLSGGERNRLHLAMTLKTDANVLLLDEPTNDLDVNTLRALENALQEFVGCAVVISHDRWFLDRIATHILAFEGNSEVVWFDGNYSDYEENRKERLGHEADQPHRIKYRHLTR